MCIRDRTHQLEDYLVSVPINADAKVKGYEIAYEQPLGDSFGFNVNYTFSDGESFHTWADNSNNLLGNSQDTVNVGAYFENQMFSARVNYTCLLYTSDAADERSSVDLGGR